MPKTQSTPLRSQKVKLAVAAEYVDTSVWTLRRRISDGSLAAYRFGREIRVDLADVDALMRPIPSAGGAA